ncbi:MAG: outer membrane protein assembly factor BamB family protein [bacterium JZ-2024 1]
MKLWRYVLVGLLVYTACGGGGGAPPQQNQQNPGQGNGNSTFIPLQILPSSTEVNPGEIVQIKAITGAALASFSWNAEAGSIIAVQEGVEEGRQFSIAWWKAPPQAGTQARVQTIVNTPTGSTSAYTTFSLTPPSGILSQWKTYQGNPEHTGLASPDAPAPDTLNLMWKVQLNDESRTPPAVSREGIVFTADLSGTVWAVDTQTGRVLWTKLLDNDVAGSPIIAGGKVFFATLGGTVYAFDPLTGQELWTFSTGGAILSSPTYVHGLLVVANNRGTVLALRTQNFVLNRAARIMWQRTFTSEFFTPGITPIETQYPFEDVRQSLVLVTSREGKVRALRVFDGATVWEKDLLDRVITTPVAFRFGAQRLVGINTAEEGKIFLLDAQTGEPFQGKFPFLRMDAPAAAPMVFHNPLLIFPSRDHRIFGLNLLTGKAELNLVLDPNLICAAPPAIRPVLGRTLPDLYFNCSQVFVDALLPPEEFSKSRGVTIRISLLPGIPQPQFVSQYYTGFIQKPLLPTFVDHPTPGAAAIQGGLLLFTGLDGALYALGPGPAQPVPSPSEWTIKRLDVQGTAYYPPSPGRGQLTVKWTFDTNAEVHSSPIVVKNQVYVTTGVGQKGRVISLRANDGNLLHIFEAPNVITSTPLYLNDILLFATRDSDWWALRVQQDRISSLFRLPFFDLFNTAEFYQQPSEDQPPELILRIVSRNVEPPGDVVQGVIRAMTTIALPPDLLYVARTSNTRTTTTSITYASGATLTTCEVTDPGLGLFPVETGTPRLSSPYVLMSSLGYYPAGDLVLGFGRSTRFCRYVCAEGTFLFTVEPSPTFLIALSSQISPFQVNCPGETQPRDFPTSVAWAVSFPGVAIPSGQPTVFQNYAFIATRERGFHIIDLSPNIPDPQNRVVYSEILPAGVFGTVPVIWDDERQVLFAFLAADNGVLYAKKISLTPQGISVSPAWEFATVSPLFGSPAVDIDSKVVYFAGTDATLYALDMITGSPLWQFTNERRARFISSPVVVGGWVYIVDEQGRVYALSR